MSGVWGAMETGYQRGKIQEESMKYETLKHDGTLPIIGVNTFQPESQTDEMTIELARSTEEENQSQIERLNKFPGIEQGHFKRSFERIKSGDH